MSLSRRQFIQASGIALCAGAVPLKASAAGQQQPLPVPPLLESRRGQPLFMTVQRAHWSFTPGTRASVWGINGRYLGPTIRVWKGDDVKLIYSNRLTENVSMTVAGLQVPGPLMGGPARMMSPNADWAPVLPIRQNAATLWYHASRTKPINGKIMVKASMFIRASHLLNRCSGSGDDGEVAAAAQGRYSLLPPRG